MFGTKGDELSSGYLLLGIPVGPPGEIAIGHLDICDTIFGKQEENESKDRLPQYKKLHLCLGSWLSGYASTRMGDLSSIPCNHRRARAQPHMPVTSVLEDRQASKPIALCSDQRMAGPGFDSTDGRPGPGGQSQLLRVFFFLRPVPVLIFSGSHRTSFDSPTVLHQTKPFPT